jgi:hypothetical protein
MLELLGLELLLRLLVCHGWMRSVGKNGRGLAFSMIDSALETSAAKVEIRKLYD